MVSVAKQSSLMVAAVPVVTVRAASVPAAGGVSLSEPIRSVCACSRLAAVCV